MTVSVDNVAKTISFKYNGILPGDYNLLVTSSVLGKLDTKAIIFTAIGIITDYTPKQGSIHGGTVLTITGFNFSNNFITDNAVHVGYTPCNVLTTSNNQITCMTQSKRASDPITEDLIVFLRTFYEADCAFGVGNCTYTWLDDTQLPVLTSYSVVFDPLVNDYVLTLVGTSFPSVTSDVKFIVDGVSQTVTTSTPTQITITLSGMADSFSNNIQFFLPSGIPAGASQLVVNGITLTPILQSIVPSIGSQFGSIITANFKGVGVKSVNISFATQTSTTTICASVTIPSYGVVQCMTKVANIPATTLSVKAGSTFYNCADPSLCAY